MAGGKENPRQKMINMMYLVLTAMLALQISNAILEKFMLLDGSLGQSNEAANLSNQKTVDAMNEAIDKNGNKPADRVHYNNAVLVRKRTNQLLAYIESLRTKIIQEAGGGEDPETGKIKNLAEEDKVANLFVTNKEGYKLRDSLNNYVEFIKKFSADTKLEPLALDAKNDPAMANADAMTRGKDFAELMFSQTPVPAALAGLSQKVNEVRRYEAIALKHLASQVGINEIKFDKLFTVVIPDSRTVVAGQTYKADIAIGAYSSAITPSISINGSPIAVKDGKGTYEVRASGGTFDSNGQLKRSYTASIAVNKPDGTREVVTTEENYTVLKPSVQISSATMPPLYFKCANRLQTVSPGLGSLYNPKYSGSGAEFIPAAGGNVTVVPTAASVTMNVENDGIVLQSFPFKVQRVPLPTVRLYVNGRPATPIELQKGLPASSVRSIGVEAVADPEFKRNNPEDAQYRVTGYTVSLAKGVRRVDSKEGVSGTYSLGSMAAQADAGSRYVVTVQGVQRRNFKGEVDPVNIGDVSFTIQLN